MKSILVVDDEPHIRRLMTNRLRDEGFQVEGAFNGAAALELLEDHAFDVVITDVEMPVMNGRELCEELRKRELDAEMQVIVITSHPREEEEDWIRLQNITFVEKPVSLLRLVPMLRERLGASADAEDSER